MSQDATLLNLFTNGIPEPENTTISRLIRAEMLEIVYTHCVFRIPQTHIMALRSLSLPEPRHKRNDSLKRIVADFRAFEAHGTDRLCCVPAPEMLMELSDDRQDVRVSFTRRLSPGTVELVREVIEGTIRTSSVKMSGSDFINVVRKVSEVSLDVDLLVEPGCLEAWWWMDSIRTREQPAPQ